MQGLWLLDMKGMPTFHYRIFSTVVFKTKTRRQKKCVKVHTTLTKLYILYLLTLILTLSPGRLFNVASENSESINVLMLNYRRLTTSSSVNINSQ